MAGLSRDLQHDRALGALLGGALGDALGMPTQSCTRAEIAAAYGEITDFVPPVDSHPIAHGLIAASITDDTEQSLLLAEHLLKSPSTFDEQGWAHRLLEWESSVKARGLHDLLGPSTKRALKALLEGESPEETGRFGNTNGAAMRIAPIGISTPVDDFSCLIDRVETTCRITHNTVEAIATASAVAAAISSGIDGADIDISVGDALKAARMVESNRDGEGGVSARLLRSLEIAEHDSGETLLSAIHEQIGTSVASIESVPAAFALFKFADGDAWKAGLLAANLGGDTDTIGAIACGMCGAVRGASTLPADKVAKLIAVNSLHLEQTVADLVKLRRQSNIAPTLMGQAT